MGRFMKNYLFSENAIIENEFIFVFLCGSAYHNNDKDKRNILSEHLKTMGLNKDEKIRPIILEKNFIFARPSRGVKKRRLSYDDINLGNLYQIESLVNFIADKTIIIHESISTGAEVGLFISNKCSWAKTCLIIPDEIAVEEDKQGSFLKLAFRNMDPQIKVLRFYPQIEKFYMSNDLSVFHTFFNNDEVGNNLSKEIEDFVKKDIPKDAFRFSKNKETAEAAGCIYYSEANDSLKVEIPPRTILTGVCSMFSIKENQHKWFKEYSESIDSLITGIVHSLKEIIKNTIEEKTGLIYSDCIITPRIPVTDINLHNTVGMCLYLLKAAGLIDINQSSLGVRLSKHVVQEKEGRQEFFYDRYADGVKERIENRIV